MTTVLEGNSVFYEQAGKGGTLRPERQAGESQGSMSGGSLCSSLEDRQSIARVKDSEAARAGPGRVPQSSLRTLRILSQPKCDGKVS